MRSNDVLHRRDVIQRKLNLKPRISKIGRNRMPDYKKELEKEKEDLWKSITGYSSPRAWMEGEKEEALNEAWYGANSIHLGSGYTITREEREKYHWHIV